MRILNKNPDNSLSILIPAPACIKNHTIEEIALKDVPSGVPFWIVPNEEIPTDRTFRNAWEIPEDMGDPSGYGSQNNTFEEIENADSE